MTSLEDQLSEYRTAAAGDVGHAYRWLMQYFRDLRGRLETTHPELQPGAIHIGAMDVTFIPVAPARLRARSLKGLLVFFHADFRFEAWLSGRNKSAQREWWPRFRDNGFSHYELIDDPDADFQFVRTVLADQPDFHMPDQLAGELVREFREFVAVIEQFLERIDPEASHG